MACHDQVVGAEPPHFKAHCVAGVDRQLFGLEHQKAFVVAQQHREHEAAQQQPPDQPTMLVLTHLCGRPAVSNTAWSVGA